MAMLVHDAVVVERVFNVPVDRVFEAWRNSAALQEWCSPGDNGWTGSVEAHDFSVGGEKRLTFGPEGDTPYCEEARYMAIEPDIHIVNSERISQGDRLISASMISLEFEPAEGGCKLTVTDQITLFDPSETSEQRREGWGEVLDKLGAYLAN